MHGEQLIPAIATTAAVTLLKVGGTALTLFFIRKGIDKFSKRKE